ncbi:Ribonuclease H2, subunit B [Corchorus olitorius]|uniref:Ribonuclease H2, subunit B n=1 Tax=Corchorus olitorius TaxID=93759 RepID=A0A1R3K8U7_9ROSI|nr:Ribonuclease H2, subunit B [Corchorus olitorius]
MVRVLGYRISQIYHRRFTCITRRSLSGRWRKLSVMEKPFKSEFELRGDLGKTSIQPRLKIGSELGPQLAISDLSWVTSFCNRVDTPSPMAKSGGSDTKYGAREIEMEKLREDLEAETRPEIAPQSSQGVDESRLLIAPGLKTSYLLCNGSLQELHWFKQSYGSWFLGDYVSEDGSLYTATPIDPVFIMLPIFEEARMKVCQLKQTLPALDQNYAARDEKDTCILLENVIYD